MAKEQRPTGAQVRGQIQSGESGDIRPGFDPAIAPMETDAEAGGQSTTAEQAQIALGTQSFGKRDNQASFDVAMRQPGSNRTTSQTGNVSMYGFIIACLILILIGLFIVSWFVPGTR
jgi:hypothetical protein